MSLDICSVGYQKWDWRITLLESGFPVWDRKCYSDGRFCAKPLITSAELGHESLV
jgi:hypothetical protein